MDMSALNDALALRDNYLVALTPETTTTAVFDVALTLAEYVKNPPFAMQTVAPHSPQRRNQQSRRETLENVQKERTAARMKNICQRATQYFRCIREIANNAQPRMMSLAGTEFHVRPLSDECARVSQVAQQANFYSVIQEAMRLFLASNVYPTTSSGNDRDYYVSIFDVLALAGDYESREFVKELNAARPQFEEFLSDAPRGFLPGDIELLLGLGLDERDDAINQ